MELEIIYNRGLRLYVDGQLPATPNRHRWSFGDGKGPGEISISLGVGDEANKPLPIGGLEVIGLRTDVPLCDDGITEAWLLTTNGEIHFKVVDTVTNGECNEDCSVTLVNGEEYEVDEITLYLRATSVDFAGATTGDARPPTTREDTMPQIASHNIQIGMYDGEVGLSGMIAITPPHADGVVKDILVGTVCGDDHVAVYVMHLDADKSGDCPSLAQSDPIYKAVSKLIDETVALVRSRFGRIEENVHFDGDFDPQNWEAEVVNGRVRIVISNNKVLIGKVVAHEGR